MNETDKNKEYASLEDAVSALFGEGVRIKGRRVVSGGDINDAYSLTLTDDRRVFMKSNRRDAIDFFREEARGLRAINKTGAIRTPEVLAIGTDGDSSFLLLSMIESGRKREDFFEDFGRRLAAMHTADTATFVKGGRYGFIHDNFIGAGKQVNSPKDTWIDFFRDCRLKVQLERAAGFFTPEDIKSANRLLDRLDEYIYEPGRPSLIHGDLWGGNYMTGEDGRAWLIDPAVYVGDAEADIAMTELFGGFHESFYSAYNEVHPLKPGYNDRKEIYNLYHLLNHLNLFGPSYLPSVRRVIGRYN